MRTPTATAAALTAACVLLQSTKVDAHTWIDCLDTDYDKIYTQSASYIFGGSGGNGFCDGYGAGYPGRGNGDIGTDYTHKMLQNEVEAGTDVCENVAADTYTNTDWRTMLSVAAGETVYFSYLPNGHVVKDKKAVGTQHGVYWTGVPGTELTSTLEMTADNLLDGYTLDFDDGNCGETTDSDGNPSGRAGDGKPCIGSFVIPTGTAAGTYSFVWYWTFWLDDTSAYVDQEQASGYFGAAYSTCFQVEVTSSGEAPAATTATPVATTATPVPTTTTPAPTTATPAPTSTPAPTTGTPAPTTTAPAATTTAPTATTAAEERSMIDTFSELNSSDASLGSVHAQESSAASNSAASSSEEVDNEVGQEIEQESVVGGVLGGSDGAGDASVGSSSSSDVVGAKTSENAAGGQFKIQDMATAVVCAAFALASLI